jgi:UDP-glucose-4-epimerase GalE
MLKIFLFFFCSALFAEPVVIVTGGAGYIGSHLCYALKKAGFKPVVFDSLVKGSEDAVKWGPFVKGDLNDSKALDELFLTYKPEAVFHFAGLILVGESVSNPYDYYHTNVSGTLNLLHAMIKHGVKKIVFSSTSSVYGNSQEALIREDHPKSPESPYARSKWFVEQILQDFENAYDLKFVSLRYFNVGGVNSEIGLRKKPTVHLIPSILSAIRENRPVYINGTDYPTPDGTAVRDYIHVMDIAEAHVSAFTYLQEGGMSTSLNLGTGKGSSVLEIITAVEKATKKNVQAVIGPRREGDAISAVSDPAKARNLINFNPKYSDLSEIIKSEWNQ